MKKLSKEEMKRVVGGVAPLLGCATHADCPSLHVCVILTYNGAEQGVCCNSEQLHDGRHVCGGGTEILT